LPGSKSFKVLLKGSNKIIISRDVTFHEGGMAAPQAAEICPAKSPAVRVSLDGSEGETALPAGKPAGAASGFDLPPELVDDGPIGDGYSSDESEDYGSATEGGASPANAGSPAPAQRRSTRAKGAYDPNADYKQAGGLKDWRLKPATGLVASTDHRLPKSVKQALSGPDAKHWREAMEAELASHELNGTWELATLPPGHKALPCMWVFNIKTNSQGELIKYKARLVALGNHQFNIGDTDALYAPVSKQTTMRSLVALAAAKGLIMEQLDVVTAFLYGSLEDEIYMRQPPGFEKSGAGVVCRLRKAIYGLRQAPKAWHSKLKTVLEELGFKESTSDPGLYICETTDGPCYLLVYVDDMLAICPVNEPIQVVKTKLGSTFSIKEMGAPATFVGINIERNPVSGEIKIHQANMIGDLVAEYLPDGYKGKLIPMSTSVALSKATEGSLVNTKTHPYSSLIGSLLYIAVCTRPDIAYSVGALTRYNAAPSTSHWNEALNVLRYLGSTKDYSITYKKGDFDFTGYSDSDYAGDKDTRRSTTGYVFLAAGGAISWSSRLQPTVAVSTAEAEFMAAAAAVKEALWLRKLKADMNIKGGALALFSDNQAAITLLKNPVNSQRSKHIDIIYHFARERTVRGEVSFTYVGTKQNAADVLTKALPLEAHRNCCQGMGMTKL
jgi:hypothetical protein